MGIGRGHERCHGEHGGDAKGDTSRRGVPVEPEGNPRDDDNQAGRDVDLNQVIAHGTDELDVASQPRIIPCSTRQTKCRQSLDDTSVRLLFNEFSNTSISYSNEGSSYICHLLMYTTLKTA